MVLKPLPVRGETVSNNMKRKLLRISELDEKSDTCTLSAYLIAQLGKNFSENEGKRDYRRRTGTADSRVLAAIPGVDTMLHARRADCEWGTAWREMSDEQT